MVKNCDNMLSRFYQIPNVTHGQTDIIPISVSRVSMLTRDRNYHRHHIGLMEH